MQEIAHTKGACRSSFECRNEIRVGIRAMWPLCN